MNILYVTSELGERNAPSIGGLASFTANMAEIMKANGHNVSIILVSTKGQNKIYDIDIPVINVFVPKDEWNEYNEVTRMLYPDCIEESDKNRKLMVDVRKSELVSQKIKEINLTNRIDIVHFSNLGGYSLFMDDAIPYVVRISGFGNILEEGAELIGGSISFSDNPIRFKDVIEIRALKRSQFTISPSRLCAEIGRSGLGISPKVIESPFSIDEKIDFNIYEKKLKGKDYILFYGKLSINKGVHIIAKFAKEFLESKKNMYIVLAGSDRNITVDGHKMLGSEYVYAKAGDYRDRIIYLGQISRENLKGVISHAEVVVLPSRMDNLPNTCIETMAQGQLVIGTRGASFEQLIEDGINGFLGVRDNEKSYLEKIYNALNLSEDEKIKMKQEAQVTIDRLSPQKIYEDYISYYTYIIEKWHDIKLYSEN